MTSRRQRVAGFAREQDALCSIVDLLFFLVQQELSQQLSQDAASAPHVHGLTIVLLNQNYFRRPVPALGHVHRQPTFLPGLLLVFRFLHFGNPAFLGKLGDLWICHHIVERLLS